jgi:hypothetical protein
MQIYNDIIYPDYYLNDNDNNDNDNEVAEKPKPKYEDKYLEDIRKMDKEFQFDEEEEKIKQTKYTEYFNTLKHDILNKIAVIENKLKKYMKKAEAEYCVYSENENSENENSENSENNEKEIFLLNQELSLLKQNDENKDEMQKKAHELSYEFIVNLRLEKIKNCFIFEYTPLGNVLMIYDSSRNSFKYYSDNNMPYRYLEPVARKYVKCYNCRPIFVDMEEELKLAEEKWEKERIEKLQKEEEEKNKKEELKASNKTTTENKKNVFAKFKSYNKDQTTVKSMVAPPKNSIPTNKTLTAEQEKEKVLLKEKANRYTYEGKISNFSFLKKIDRKVVDKKYGMTFSDFKKLQKK